VIRADGDPSDIVGDVVDAVGHGARQLWVDEVVNVDKLRRVLGVPLLAIVLIVANEFLLLGVNGYDRLTRAQERRGLRVDVAKLRITIDVLASFPRLGVGLQAIA
jgi:hypothetical protein